MESWRCLVVGGVMAQVAWHSGPCGIDRRMHLRLVGFRSHFVNATKFEFNGL